MYQNVIGGKYFSKVAATMINNLEEKLVKGISGWVIKLLQGF